MRENVMRSTGELLLKMNTILEKNGGEFIVGKRVCELKILATL